MLVGMKAEALSPRALFDGVVHYEIPVYQRPYVWNEDEQWAPLWADIRRLADRIITAKTDGLPSRAVSAHFLGAVVLKGKQLESGDVARHEVVDGQQRITTLQLLMNAARTTLTDFGYTDQAEGVEELTLNSAKRFEGKVERFKLRPSRGDRDAFLAVMEGSVPNSLVEHRVIEAHRFFELQIKHWLEASNENVVGTTSQRVKALTDALEAKLQVVAIDLAGEDDDQLIFETLNDRGTPLLKADLVKNWIFQQGDRIGANVELWADSYWAEFDDEWWREEVSQGRHLRSRLDTFLQYWLTMHSATEVLTDDIFTAFRNYAEPSMNSVAEADAFLKQLQADSDMYRSLATGGDGNRAITEFYSTVVQTYELAAVMPLLMWLVSPSREIPEDQIVRGLAGVESWVVRRTLLRYTMSDVNRFIVAILQGIRDAPYETIGDTIVALLRGQTANTRLWPSDKEVLTLVPTLRMYGNIRQNRLRKVLEGVEKKIRTERHENVSLPAGLEIEHIMPQKWRRYWDSTPPLSDDAAAERDLVVNSLGNLTLVTQKLNGTLSNRPWTDAAAGEVNTTGPRKGIGKRTLISEFSLLAINKAVVDHHQLQWTDANILERSKLLSQRICEVWPRG